MKSKTGCKNKESTNRHHRKGHTDGFSHRNEKEQKEEKSHKSHGLVYKSVLSWKH